jgi:lysophospholipase L1-like esterase/uncharacterized protein YneF (UPF0154 family)
MRPLLAKCNFSKGLVILISLTLILLYIGLFFKIRAHIKEISDFPLVNKEKIAAFKMEPVKNPEFLFLGNSITEGFDLKKHFGKPYLNRGIGGNTTEAVLYRLDEVINREPKNIILMIGVNDISRGVEENEILDNYGSILKRLRSSLPNCKLFTLSILPVRESYDTRRIAINTAYWISFIRPFDINPKIVSLNNKVQKISADNGAIFLNIHANYLDSNIDAHLNEKLAYDNVHLNEKGYELLAELLKERIDGI